MVTVADVACWVHCFSPVFGKEKELPLDQRMVQAKTTIRFV